MNWIEKQIRKTGMKRLAWAALILAILVLTGIVEARYLSNFFKGPQTITKEELDQLHSAADLKRYWVTITADELINTEFQEITVHKNHGIETSRSVTATYYVARFGDRLLPIKMRHYVPGTTVTGSLEVPSGDVDDAFFASPGAQEHKAEFYPSMVLDNDDFRINGYFGLAGGIVALIVALVLGWAGLSFMRNPRQHKMMREIEIWGDVDQISRRIEQELAGGQALKLGNTVFTPNFVVQRTSYYFGLMRTEDLLWVYQRVTKHKQYFITTGKTYSLSISSANETMMINGKEKIIAQVMERLAAKQPWIIFGYSDELMKIFKKQRQQMVKEVAARKQKALTDAKLA